MQGDQAPPQMQQQQVILTRLDGPDAQEIRTVAWFRSDVRRRHRNGEGRHMHSSTLGEIGRQCRPCRDRVHDNAVRQLSHGRHTAPMPNVLTRTAIFREFERNQVVD
jgi:hypothetical protein